MVEPSDEPFGDALRALLLADGDIYVSAGGNVKWGTFAHVLHGISYDILRRTVRGERPPHGGRAIRGTMPAARATA